MSYGGLSGTQTVREQCCDLEDYPGGTPEDHIENPIHQRLIEIMHEGAKGDIPILRTRCELNNLLVPLSCSLANIDN